jgi:tetratricopeptide (TPR) repeat protein
MVLRHRYTLALLLVLALGPVCPSASAQEKGQLADRYSTVVTLYRSGRANEAIDRLVRENQEDLLPFVERYVKRGATFVGTDGAPDDGFARAASLLHADAAFQLWRGELDKLASAHFAVARALIDLAERAGGASKSFRARWYHATTLITTRLVSPETAGMYLQDAVNRVPGDVPILTAAGWFAARRADLPAAPDWNLRTAQRTRREHQEEAVRFLTSALTVDPSAAEAALRLADVESAMGREEHAANRLAALLARDDLHRSLAYVGHLVLGRIREQQGDTHDAERLYRQALALDSVAQSARVAVARLRYAAGDSAEAADIVDPMLTAGDTREGNDPWSDYRLVYPIVGQLIFDELVTEVQR